MLRIQIVPVGRVELELLEFLALALPEHIGRPCVVARKGIVARDAYDPARRQFHSTKLLERLAALPRSPGDRTLGVTEVDLFVPILTFVFGEAQVRGPAALLSTARLRQEFYGLPADETLLYERSAKEALHELGHTQGLGHCRLHVCVMHYSNSIEDVDLKGGSWCPECLALRSD
jgi:archaemetzincin